MDGMGTRTVARTPAWGADLPTSDDQARDRLLDAAEACYAERGLDATKMTHIANKAGVHRSTVYSYFPNRDAVLAECFLRAVTAVLDATQRCWETDEPFADQLVSSCMVGIAAARESPTMRMFTFDDKLGRTYHAASASEKWQSRLREVLGERFADAAARGDVRDDVAPETMAYWVARICFSLMAEPGPAEYGGDEGLLRAFLPGAFSPR
ncbi:TetR family transcriptional regulator [Mycolicibacterium anyangense]|uniref:TetR family transcriptional regulator n=1 Tax=Mycolicibacterium anyangense TaxID=1431246 RepID=A0A6N4W9T2_9MYCO|nr:TetR/AcrR family transcriptional regulator [Mycolicibacterium anyangense]BBZ78790.1 TetR family transcriptional regulator [Mycolicibacterium anyangense]